MNFHISKTLLYQISKYFINCSRISVKKVRALVIGITFLEVPFSKWTIILALNLIVFFFVFAIYRVFIFHKVLLAICFTVLWHGRTCLGLVWVKWIRFALLWYEGLVKYCHCYFCLYLLNMSDFYVIKLLEVTITFFYSFFHFFKKSVLVLFLEMKWNKWMNEWKKLKCYSSTYKYKCIAIIT